MTFQTKSDAVMQRALELARAAGVAGEVPVAAIITNRQGEIVAEAANAGHLKYHRTCGNAGN